MKINKRILLMAFSVIAGLFIISCDSASNSSSREDATSSDEQSKAPIEVEGSLMEETDINIETYTNFLMDGNTPNAWDGYGFGDPFVMRHNGKYYLYSSTHDLFNSIKVWTSDDLVNWEYGGDCATDDKLLCAYAPEVTYYNGYFYMYTSPGGNGHYILRADNPLGPFRVLTHNLGNSIDGHVFIDDNGKWYFYHAGLEEIQVKEMRSPLDINRPDQSTGASINGNWTEGAMVIKRNGFYYLTYCGNHVWSKGYRIEGAVSATNPMDFSNDIPGSILMLNTDDPVYGIGHSSTVLGPDLDTYYIVYHSFERVGSRRLNIDALCLNGKDFSALGPTTTPQQIPKKPEISTDCTSFSDRFEYENAEIENGAVTLSEKGSMLTKDKITSDKYTVEVNFLKLQGKAGFIFSYVDENNYSSAYLNTKTQKLTVSVYSNGEKITDRSFSLPKSFSQNTNFKKLQTLSMKKDGEKFTFYLNNLDLGTLKLKASEGKLGIKVIEGYAFLGHTSISYAANGSSLKTYYKPIEGEITAITSVENGETEIIDGISYVVMKQDYIRNYYVNIGKTDEYDVKITYFSEVDTKLEIYKSGVLIGSIVLPATNKEISSIPLRNVSLKKGFGILSFKAVSGKANILSYTFTPNDDIKNINISRPEYFDGTWSFSSEGISLIQKNSSLPHGKVFYGEEGWGDYTVSADFTFGSNKMAGMIVRANNPAIGGAGDDTILGRYFYQGYYIGFDSAKSVAVYKINYARGDLLAAFKIPFNAGNKCYLKVECIGNSLNIYLDDTLLGTVTDTYLPYLNGNIGFTGFGSVVDIKNLNVQSQ